jgi:hypothetical protein
MLGALTDNLGLHTVMPVVLRDVIRSVEVDCVTTRRPSDLPGGLSKDCMVMTGHYDREASGVRRAVEFRSERFFRGDFPVLSGVVIYPRPAGTSTGGPT